MDTAPPAVNTKTGNNVEGKETLMDTSLPSPAAGRVLSSDVGIFCWDSNTDVASLVHPLVPTTGCSAMIPVSADNERDWRQIERFSTVIIIYPSQSSAAPGTPLRRFLDFCSDTRGSENMIVVITDLENTESKNRKLAEWEDRQYSRYPPLILTEAEMDVISTDDRTDVSNGRRMAKKVTGMKNILHSPGAENSHHVPQKPKKQKSKPIVGIFSRDDRSQYSWLVNVLGSDAEVRPCYISNSGSQQFYRDVSQCTFGILYHTKNRGRVNVTDVMDSLYDDELRHLSSTLGKNKVIVVIDDLEESSDEEKCQILKHQPKIRVMAQDLFLISHKEKTSDYERRVLVDREEPRRKLQKLIDIIRKMKTGDKDEWQIAQCDPETRTEKEKSKRREPANKRVPGTGDIQCDPMKTGKEEKSKGREPANKRVPGAVGEDYGGSSTVHGERDKRSTKPESISGQTKNWLPSISSLGISFPTFPAFPASFSRRSIGIFSRCSESEYSWLKTLLESGDFSNKVQSVQSYNISNRISSFYRDVSQCTFGILYHSKNRGRVNVTDVMDSLYDEELGHLSSTLGKKNVVVVIDDLEDSSDAKKEEILSAQHSIQKRAQDLLLVKRTSSEEKMRATKSAFRNVLH